MSSLKRALSLFLALLVITALFSGCANNNPLESPGTASSSPPAKAVMGGDLTVGIAQDLDLPVDPHQMVAAGTRELLFNVYEGLVKPDTGGNLIPAVAESYETSATGDAFTFTLRQGIKFHNGEAVTAADVVYSVSRAAGLDTGTPLVSALSIIKSVEAENDRTVVITLTEPNIEALALLTVAIIPDGNDPTLDIIGTGPFKFESRVPQESIYIVKFADYWGASAYVDSVTYKVIESGETLVMSLMSGAVDLVPHLTSAQINELGEGYNVAYGTMNLVQAVYLNNAVVPFDNVNVRRALSYAIDRQQVLDFLYEGGGAIIGSSMYPAFKKYFREDLVDYYQYDVEKAKQLLAEAGYPDGFTMTIIAPSNYTPHVDTATVVAEQLKQIGVTVEVQLVDFNTWLSDVYGGRSFQATIIGVDASTLTASALLSRFVSNASGNFINFSNEEYDEVFRKAQASTDDAEQVELYGRLQEILTEQAANLYIHDLCDIVAMQKNVGGYEFYPLYAVDVSKVYFTD